MHLDPIRAARARVARLTRARAGLDAAVARPRRVRRVERQAVRAWAAMRRTWRRSLQFRIVGITLLVSAVLVTTFGLTVAALITHGILESKLTVSKDIVQKGADTAATSLSSFNQADDPGLLAKVPTLVATLATTADPSNTVDVVILRVSPPLNLAPRASAAPDTAAYAEMQSQSMAKLRAAVTGKQGGVYYQYATFGLKAYMVFGTPVPTADAAPPLQLYYLFPIDREQSNVDLVRLVVLGTGIALVALLALVVGLMTRLVVVPVRVAARTAQRLSAGLLDQRMQVRGEDDLARLAAAFNQMAANLQRQIVRLEEMSRLQRRFTSDVSHELRTPLTTVRMAADLLFSSRDEFDPPAARSAELLQAELDRFEGLLTDLLEISRFDAGFAALDAEPADLVPVVHRVGERLTALAERCEVDLRIEVPDGPVIAEVDTRRVERILRNLVGNAVEHGEKRPVLVTLATDEAAVAVTVRDHGIGLKTGEEKLVFNRFWRADPSRARQTGGTGLGLSISLEDARLHGGWLEAWGAPGKGAQFRLTLPVREGDRLVSSPLRLVPDDARADESADVTLPLAGAGPA
jgi:two-component system sensor histidine kinase MtrB